MISNFEDAPSGSGSTNLPVPTTPGSEHLYLCEQKTQKQNVIGEQDEQDDDIIDGDEVYGVDTNEEKEIRTAEEWEEFRKEDEELIRAQERESRRIRDSFLPVDNKDRCAGSGDSDVNAKTHKLTPIEEEMERELQKEEKKKTKPKKKKQGKQARERGKSVNKTEHDIDESRAVTITESDTPGERVEASTVSASIWMPLHLALAMARKPISQPPVAASAAFPTPPIINAIARPVDPSAKTEIVTRKKVSKIRHEERLDKECTMCFEVLPFVVFLPCKHTVMCRDCANAWVARKALCSHCSRPITCIKDVN